MQLPNTIPTSATKDSVAVMRSELDRGEFLLWAGQPRQGLFLSPDDAFATVWNLVFGAIGIFIGLQALISGPLFFGILFVAGGLYALAGSFFVESRVRADTHYAVTTDGVIFVTLWPWKRLNFVTYRSMAANPNDSMRLREHADGRGTIEFGPKSWKTLFQSNQDNAGTNPAMKSIANVSDVYALIQAAQHHDVRPSQYLASR